MSVFIAAEAGVNHLGDRAKMLALCDAAKMCGADAVKFQAYNAEALIARRGKLGMMPQNYPYDETSKLLFRCELSDADLDAIAAHCKAIGIKWFASVFDPSQIERVLSRGAWGLKIGHAESDWEELLRACLEKQSGNIPVYVSNPPWRYIDEPNVGRVRCVAEYPAKSNPRLHWLRSGEWHGFSSHYEDWRVPAVAALNGAHYLEVHLKVSDEDPEAQWSLSVADFRKMVDRVREAETWL